MLALSRASDEISNAYDIIAKFTKEAFKNKQFTDMFLLISINISLSKILGDFLEK